jgi:hypothetical protein
MFDTTLFRYERPECWHSIRDNKMAARDAHNMMPGDEHYVEGDREDLHVPVPLRD